MTTFVPSIQQAAVFSWVSTGIGNAFVEAVAGSGKTTTLVEAIKLTTGTVAFAAYNKKIADEVKGKLEKLNLGNRAKVGTFHSFGFGAWRHAHPKVKVDADLKRDRMIKENRLPDSWASTCVKLVSLAKQAGVGLYFNENDDSKLYDIVEHHDLTSDLENPDDMDFVVQAAKRCIRWARDIGGELIDFDDMIWLPIITNVRIWGNDWIFVDEAQDTNPARRALARKMLSKNGRAIFVGDRHQAIYGFTGADSDAVDRIISDFNCCQLPLTVTYRCPRSVVEVAQGYVSHITAHESAPAGWVDNMGREDFIKLGTTAVTLGDHNYEALRVGDAILCRNTKPLVSLAFSLIRRGVGCHVEGRDIGNGLKVLATRWKVQDAETLRQRLEEYREREVAKATAKGKETMAESINDKVETLLVVMEGCGTVQCVLDKINKLFQDTDGRRPTTVTLSTVHKSKGREWERVFILGFNHYMPSPWARQAWQQEQETNLIYVAVTRSQNKLVLLPALEDKK